MAKGMPVRTVTPVRVEYGTYISPFVEITSQDAALDAGDSVGTSVFLIPAPVSGVIQSATLFDPADQKIELDVVLLSSRFTPTAADAAFTLADADLRFVIYQLNFTVFWDMTDGAVSSIENIGKAYRIPPYGAAPEMGYFYCQAITRGAPTYAAGSKPYMQIEILPDKVLEG